MDKLVVILDDIRSLYNVGSIFRTADAAGVDKIYLCGITARPVGKQAEKISKVALGAEKEVSWEYVPQSWRLVEKLQAQGYQIVALELTDEAITYEKFKPCFPLALILGREVEGVKRSLLRRSDAVISLPMRGKKESLNVAVAFGIATYHLSSFKR